MENELGNVETDSVADLEVHVRELVDPTDPIAELCAHVLDKEVDPILAGSAEAMAVGNRADVNAHQASTPDVGHIAEGFEPLGDPQSSSLAWPLRLWLTAMEQSSQR